MADLYCSALVQNTGSLLSYASKLELPEDDALPSLTYGSIAEIKKGVEGGEKYFEVHFAGPSPTAIAPLLSPAEKLYALSGPVRDALHPSRCIGIQDLHVKITGAQQLVKAVRNPKFFYNVPDEDTLREILNTTAWGKREQIVSELLRSLRAYKAKAGELMGLGLPNTDRKSVV